MSAMIEQTVQSILTNYPIKRAAFFGSTARNEMKAHSDVDMLVEFMPESNGLDFFGLHADLEQALNCRVDLLTYYGLLNDAKPSFKNAVLRDEKVIYEHQG